MNKVLFEINNRCDCPHIGKSNCYLLEFYVSGYSGKFIGTKEEIHKQIDSYKWTGLKSSMKRENISKMITDCISCLKYGYLFEFENSDYDNYEVVIDNGMWIQITRI